MSPEVTPEHSEAVLVAARWLADQTPPPPRAVPALKGRFNLSALEACQAIAMADRFRALRRAHG